MGKDWEYAQHSHKVKEQGGVAEYDESIRKEEAEKWKDIVIHLTVGVILTLPLALESITRNGRLLINKIKCTRKKDIPEETENANDISKPS